MIVLPVGMTRSRRRTPKTTPSTFTAMARRYWSSVRLPTPFPPVSTPAFKQARSTEPMCSQHSGSATSNPLTRSSSCTSNPSPRNFSTIALPIPPAEPVTSAVTEPEPPFPSSFVPRSGGAPRPPARAGTLHRRSAGQRHRPRGGGRRAPPARRGRGFARCRRARKNPWTPMLRPTNHVGLTSCQRPPA